MNRKEYMEGYNAATKITELDKERLDELEAKNERLEDELISADEDFEVLKEELDEAKAKIKRLHRIIKNGGKLNKEVADELETHIEWVETERDNAQADLSLIIKACRATGQERDRNAHPSMGDDIAAFVTQSQTREAGWRMALEKIININQGAALYEEHVFTIVKKALTSTNTDYYKEQLAEVEEVLEALTPAYGFLEMPKIDKVRIKLEKRRKLLLEEMK